jgi:hypothetical protein
MITFCNIPGDGKVINKYLSPVCSFLFLATGGFSTAQATTIIKTAIQLQAIQSNLAGSYVLGADIDATATSGWNDGLGFLPLGSGSTPFTGLFNGNGHTIKGLYILSSAAAVGLFGQIGSTGVVENVALSGGSVTASSTPITPVGALAGSNAGTISNSYANVAVTGGQSVDDPTGGLVGTNNGQIGYSHATGAVSGADQGGLVGDNNDSIVNCFASGSVAGGAGGYRASGGLVGGNYGSIQGSFATGSVAGNFGRIGGLVGFNEMGSVANSYASGSVSGTNGVNVGGLVGENNGSVQLSYSTGSVGGSGTYTAGGLIGVSDSSGTVADSYWDTNTSGQTTSAGGSGKNTKQLESGLPAGFSTQIWSIVPGTSYPFLPST